MAIRWIYVGDGNEVETWDDEKVHVDWYQRAILAEQQLDAVREKIEGCCEYDSYVTSRRVIRGIQALLKGEQP